jgi:type IV secretory pathway protease TraF
MTRASKALPHAFLALVAVSGPAAAARLAHGEPPAPLLLINETRSAPRGLYLRSADREPRRGRRVTIAQPPAARPYLARLGAPAEMRLLKRVAAVGGERVCVEGLVLQTPREAVRILLRDRRGAPLPAWRGCRPLTADEVLLLGDGPESFDGRYFGPVRRDRIEAAYEEVLRW